MGALAVTGTPKYREAFGPLIGKVQFGNMNDIESIKDKITDKTSAIILETIQGEGGIYPATKEFLKEIEVICRKKDIVLIIDEIQCGMGRTGTMFAFQHYGIKPDVITCAKALGCGVPVGAFVANEKVGAAFEPGDHGTTYGGNPFATEAVRTVFQIYEEEKILAHVNEVAPYLEEKLDELCKEYEVIKERRGMGLMQGLEFLCPVKDYIQKAMDAGLILIAAGTNVIRFLPPLIVTKEEIDEMVGILRSILE